ncbi:methyltransferase domain-containing protein [Lysobacter capsici]|uniref:methyltransferase domain-containing protein n=1 Tax=Lysobacter capsici TaxID=435897 RepID=UPI000448F3F8|nr:methyltransferase domain-containing protein [Lysobacter capsici]
MKKRNSAIDVDALISQLRLELDGVDSASARTGGALMRRVREEVARRRAAQEAETVAQVESSESAISLPRWLGAAGAVPLKREYVIGELLALDDREFVEVAYKVLLRREGDPAGVAHALNSLRSGVSKVEILHSIRFSPEGLARGVHVDGLLAPYLLQKWRRIPLVGSLIGWAHAFVRLPWMLRNLGQMDAMRAREIQGLGEHVNALSRDVEGQLTPIAGMGDQVVRVQSNIDSLSEVVQDRYVSEGELRENVALLEFDVRELTDELDRTNRRLQELESRFNARESYEHPLPANALDDMYVQFEETFRGSPELIRERASHYLDLVRSVGAGSEDAPVIDLGCGRGDWLDMLRENGLHARGIDNNQAFLRLNRERGHDVIEADAMQGLRAMRTGSAGAITGMHIAEHLPFEVLVAMVDECRRVLRPGGLLALETPNPENLAVASHYFYLDPTHRNPLPPEALRWIVAARQFTHVRIERLMESRDLHAPALLAEDQPGAESINAVLQLFHNAPDYAVVGIAP